MAQKITQTLFVITGNRLVDGRVLYRRADGSWAPELEGAEEIAEPARKDALVAQAQAALRTEITGIYALEVGVTAEGARVLSAREQIRAGGEASVRRRLGHAA